MAASFSHPQTQFRLAALMSTILKEKIYPSPMYTLIYDTIQTWLWTFSLSHALIIYKSEMLTSRKFSFFNFFLILFNAKSLQKSYLIHSFLKQKCWKKWMKMCYTHAPNISTSHFLKCIKPGIWLCKEPLKKSNRRLWNVSSPLK